MYSEAERRYVQQRLFLLDILFAYSIVIGLLRRCQIISFKYSPNYVIAAIFLALLVLCVSCIVLDNKLKKKAPDLKIKIVACIKDTRLRWIYLFHVIKEYCCWFPVRIHEYSYSNSIIFTKFHIPYTSSLISNVCPRISYIII